MAQHDQCQRSSPVNPAATLLLCACVFVGGCVRCPPTADYLRDSHERAVRVHLDELPPAKIVTHPISAAAYVSDFSGVDPESAVAEFDAADQREISLRSAIARAFRSSETLRVLDGGSSTLGVATVYDAVITETNVQSALSAFDTNFFFSHRHSGDDIPPNRQNIGIVTPPVFLDGAQGALGVQRRFINGGTSTVRYDLNYIFRTNSATSAPQYGSSLRLQHRQPLARGAGKYINRIPLIVARGQTDQSLTDIRLAALRLAADIESTYWNLYAAIEAYEANKKTLGLSREVVRIQEARLKRGQVAEADVAQAKSQLNSFNAFRYELVSRVLNQESLLRNLIGDNIDSKTRLIPSDRPNSELPGLDYRFLVESAVNLRPDIRSRRIGLSNLRHQINLANNQRKPQVDFVSEVGFDGTGNDLGQANAEVLDGRYVDWVMGVEVLVPVQRNAASALERAAILQHRRETALLNQQIHAVSHEINQRIQNLYAVHRQVKEVEKRNGNIEDWLTGALARFQNPPLGQDLLLALRNYQSALQVYVDSRSETAALLAQIETELALLRQSTGELLDDHQILMADSAEALVYFNVASPQEEVFAEDSVLDLVPAVPEEMPDESL